MTAGHKRYQKLPPMARYFVATGVHPVTRSLRVGVIDLVVRIKAPVQRRTKAPGTHRLLLRTDSCLCAAQKLSSEQPPMSQPPNARVSTITPASASILDRIGAWPVLAPPVSAAFGSMQVLMVRHHALDCTHIRSEGCPMHPRLAGSAMLPVLDTSR